jgi:hypothetical protein
MKKIWKSEILPKLKEEANVRFQNAKQFILNEVRNHPVSRELDSKTAPSQFLPSASSTLFGFMGFYDGSDPVGDLVSYLDENISMKFSVRVGNMVLISSLSVPNKKQMALEESLQMPWLGGISWPEAVEKGVSGLKYFLGIEGKGRSDLGIQAKVAHNPEGPLQQVRRGEMKKVAFLSKIFSDAKKLA